MSEDKLSQTMSLGFGGAFGITNLETDRPIGMMADISLDKIELTTWKEIKPNALFNLRLRLPEAFNGSVFVVFDAKCVSCKPGAGQNSFIVELAYVNITSSNHKRIRNLLISLGKMQAASTMETE